MGRTVAFAVSGRPSRWQRPSQHFDKRTGRLIRHTDPQARAEKLVIAQCAKLAWGGAEPACGPVALQLDFIFRIPPSWPEAVKQAAREGRVRHIQDPDYDQLAKQVMDALVGIAYVDDNQVSDWPQGHKRYGHPERTEVRIHILDQQPDEITPGQREVRKRAAKAGLVAGEPQMALFGGSENPSKAKRRKGR